MPGRKKWQPAGIISVMNEKGRRVRRRVRYTGQQIMDFINNNNEDRLNQPQEQPENNQILQAESVLVDTPHVTEDSSHKKRKICEAEAWQEIRDEMVHVRIESLSPAGNQCSFCSKEFEEIIWCPDCGPNSLYCINCNEHIHRVVQYHQPFLWKNDVSLFVPVFREASLAQGHVCDTKYCRKITVFDALGRHHIVVGNFCNCESEAVTLIRQGLWPATPSNPQTAFSIDLMETCRVLQLEGHLSLQKFCNAVTKRINFMPHLRNNTNLYNALGNALLEFHHHQVTCLEIAQAPDIVGKNCPVCMMKPERAVFSMDANFGLVHKMHSGSGPGLDHARFSLFCPDEEVKSFVNAHHEATSKSKNSSSDCSNFQAGDVVRSKNRSARLDIKGVFGAICHHGFPVHIVNMQHGERFGYPVYILKKIAAGQAGTMPTKQTVMYDVACGLDAHLKRHSQLIERLNDKVRLVVPIFHSFAHIAKCQMTYGQRFSEGTGLIDGEGMERLWPYLRRFFYTKEMTLPNRQDLLSSALLHYARRNFSSIANTLGARLKKARELQLKLKAIIQDTERKYEGTAETWLHMLRQILVTASLENGLSAKDALMEKGKKLSTERQHLSTLMKRYADGQKIAVRLTKKLQTNSKQLQALSDELKVKGVHITVAQLADPESSVYDHNLPHLNKDQVHAANCIAELCRAQEEEKRIIQDINLLQQWLINQNMSLNNLCAPIARCDKALQYLRCLSKLNVETQLKKLHTMFNQESGLEQVTVDYTVTNLLSVSQFHKPLPEDTFDVAEVTDIRSDIESDSDIDDFDEN